MGRINVPREHSRAPERTFPMSAYTAGFLAFVSTTYVLLNRQPLIAVLTVGFFWVLGLLLLSRLSNGRWLVVLEYFAELRAYERNSVARNSPPKVAPLGAEAVDLSDQERELFSKLMGDAGFDSNWPKG